jgi:hypothetical protein
MIAPIVKTREQADYPGEALGSFLADRPMPLLPMGAVPAWRRRPLSIAIGPDRQEVRSYDPPPVRVSPEALETTLRTFAASLSADALLNAAKLYKTAMELIESRPDISYQLLISTAESLANVALPEYQPDEEERIASKKSLTQYARKCGVGEDQARQIALEACRGNPWSKRKFRLFLSRYASDDIWQPDDVFIPPPNLCPDPGDFDKVLGRIYELRSQNLHAGSSFPPSIGLGTSPFYKAKDLPLDFLSKAEIPAVVWFERVVSSAAQALVAEVTKTKRPFEGLEGRRH